VFVKLSMTTSFWNYSILPRDC